MDPKEILNFCLKKGLLLDREVLKLFSESVDFESAKLIIEKIQKHSSQRIITKTVFNENKDKVKQFFLDLPEEKVQKLKVKLGLNIEISKEISRKSLDTLEKGKNEKDFILDYNNIKINSLIQDFKKKPVVNDFVNYFKNRLYEMKEYLQVHSNLKNPVSINKISSDRGNFSLIGIVFDKRITKNKNILLELEDLTGTIKVLINQNKPEVYKKGEEISLDSVIGVNCSGSREIVFANDIIFPDTALLERKKSPYDESVLFISDLHMGSKLFLEKKFQKFINYLNGEIPGSNKEEIDKIKYLFIVGDLVAGVGIYPSQEKDLIYNNLEEQFLKAAEMLKKIRKDIKIILSPGNHDCVRLMEPQPILDEKYAWPIFDLKNVFLTGNPAYVNIGAKQGFQGFDVLTYHGFSFPYYANIIPSLIVGRMNSPEKIMAYLLKNRHLAPTHKSVQYFPSEKDNLIIRKIPDILVSGHSHKSAVTYYNNILIISGSSWEEITPFQEKMGNEPDFCKVPMFNLKTRQIKILDFE